MQTVVDSQASAEFTTSSPGDLMHRLSQQDRQMLIEGLSADSAWIAQSACYLLAGLHNDRLRDQLLELIPTLPPARRARTSGLACDVSLTPTATIRLLLNSADPTVRYGAAYYLCFLAGPADEVADLHATVRNDPNLSVRQAAGLEDEAAAPGSPPPTEWLCADCASANDIVTGQCQRCRSTMRSASR
ncbi:hypothetical protein ACQPZJ_37920 [Actinoplanes sp. CA-054009]